MGFVFCDSYYPTDKGGPARMTRVNKGVSTGKEGPDEERGTNEEGPDEVEGTNEKRPSKRKLDGCIMHQVHTNIYIYIYISLLDTQEDEKIYIFSSTSWSHSSIHSRTFRLHIFVFCLVSFVDPVDGFSSTYFRILSGLVRRSIRRLFLYVFSSSVWS